MCYDILSSSLYRVAGYRSLSCPRYGVVGIGGPLVESGRLVMYPRRATNVPKLRTECLFCAEAVDRFSHSC